MSVKIYSISLLILLFTQCSINQSKDTSEWIETIGEMKGPPSHRQVYYNVNGRIYNRSTSYKVGNIYNGEYVKLKYNPKAHDECVILRWKECFLEDESTFFVIGEIKTLYEKGIFHTGGPRIYYTFSANNVKLEKVQWINPNFKNLFSEVSEGKQFKVECWTNNPQRAIMHLDKPVN